MMEFLNSINFFEDMMMVTSVIGFASMVLYVMPYKEDSKILKFLSIIALKKEVQETTQHTNPWNQGTPPPHTHPQNINQNINGNRNPYCPGTANLRWVIEGNKFMEGMEGMEDKPPEHPLPNRRAAIAHTKDMS